MGEDGDREGSQGSGDLSSVEYLLPFSMHLYSGMRGATAHAHASLGKGC